MHSVEMDRVDPLVGLPQSKKAVAQSPAPPDPATQAAVPHLASTAPLRPAEGWLRRGVYWVLILALCAGFFAFVFHYWTPAHSGINVDQNGYLMGGKVLATQRDPAIRPANPDTGEFDPFAFIGQMWVGFDIGTPQERYYPKYPLGLPLIYAAAWTAGGGTAGSGVTFAYMVNPIAMTLSVLGMFLLLRAVAGSFAGLLGAIALAGSQLALLLANNPNSHATTLLFITWGMLMLVRWWQNGGFWRAALAGLLVGYAVTIRYSEGILVLPLIYVALEKSLPQLLPWNWTALRTRLGAAPIEPPQRQLRLVLQAKLMGFMWLLPVGLLVLFNWRAMGTLTGYDHTNESTGFAWAYFVDNWPRALNQMNRDGLLYLFGLGMAGMVGLLFWHARLAAVMGMWILATLGVYTFYYFAPNILVLGYLRFFITMLPPLIFCAVLLLMLPKLALRAAPVAAGAEAALPLLRRMRAAFVVTALLLCTGSAVYSAYHAWFTLDHVARRDRNLHARSEMIREHVPAGSVIFSNDNELLHHLQFAGDWRLYSADVFDRGRIHRNVRRDEDDPHWEDPQRRASLLQRVGHMSTSQLAEQRHRIARDALENGQRVFVPAPGLGGVFIGAFFPRSQFRIEPIASVEDPHGVRLLPDTPDGGLFAGLGRRSPRQTRSEPPKTTWHLYEITPR